MSKNRINKNEGRPKWTVMVYFAADNDLNEYAIDNLDQMRGVDIKEGNVNLIAQIDYSNNKPTKRFYTENAKWKEKEIGETDAGSAGVLSE
jgi:hypothetical protein